ncbi:MULTISPECIES: penicillin-binding protein 2 [unclassified Mucilaginibacter]|uniref:penicillin-binding protein 2 n=1 Tax=unclassified Mucilaginibacter TaxID=2617802 RepID=UPI002AC912CB|nr:MULTISPECIES: penicillin-binding protein 2 [unclassified Mucilaginibacter]MEB0261347.1 penicillin-binding protein 2 [Mucilaginibacter sp. 10I4]MEB0278154.1 penicillin-binding protein 2 [Mucilaginibacter sp. 10B2]MEB0301388.1 penicillin-binding protein 2 [Mucilaginibacter sp. 5C4]WPX23066.1 penicillin-binding protein 2 [Mucilaginibacter sp. 5C4]
MNSFFERRYVIAGIFITLILVLLARLFYIQVVDDRYALYASQNVVRKFVKYPARGPILDRTGKIMVQNEPVYDITVVPKQVKAFDTVEFCKLLGIDREGYDKRMIKARKYSPYRTSVFEKQVTVEQYAAFQERLSEFPGFDTQQRSLRTYPDTAAAQFLGYIGEATDAIIKRSNGYYSPGDYVGITGVEKSYETVLRGQRGVENMMVDSRNVRKGKYANGAFDTSAVAGERLISSLDMTIQKLGEKLMTNKVGSIVAIEPSTGEILCFVSSPTYDPNLLVGRQRGNNAAALYKDPYKPFFTRPVQAYYPPGSSFKPLSALIGLQEGIIKPTDTYNCIGYYMAGNHRVKCTHVHGTVNLAGAIAGSCNGYFNMVFAKVLNAQGGKNTDASYTSWKANVNKFGFGERLGVDIPSEGKGLVPTANYYDKIYHRGGWRSTTVASLAIGQGELLATPLQLANIEATIANHGFYYKPHLIKAIGDKQVIKKEYTVKNYVGIDAQYFEPVINGMQSVVDYGTGQGSKIPGIVMCGKTGTAQNPHGKNHSLFVAFAPRDNPKIAIAVVVENSGDGGTWAAPIASFIVEQYLKGSISKRPSGIYPEYYIEKNLLPAIIVKPVDKARIKADSIKKATADSVKKAAIDSVSKLKSAKNKPAKKAEQNKLTALLPKRRGDE